MNDVGSVAIVGDDAHIVPKPHGTTRFVEWNEGMGWKRNIPHSTDHGNQPTWRDDVASPTRGSGVQSIQPGMELNLPGRDDVGIVPYKENGGAEKNIYKGEMLWKTR